MIVILGSVDVFSDSSEEIVFESKGEGLVRRKVRPLNELNSQALSRIIEFFIDENRKEVTDGSRSKT